MKITIVGAGSFGTAMAAVAARGGHDVMLWAHDPRVSEAIRAQHANPVYLSELKLDEKIQATSDIVEAVAFSDMLMMVVPSHHYRRVLTEVKPHLTQPAKVISGTKGIENESLDRMSQITKEVLGDALHAFAVLSGPTFAIESARGDPTAAVVASSNEEFSHEVQRLLSSPTFRLYNSTDVAGVEIAGSLKNVIAIAAGVLEGLGLGANTNAALVTRGLHEITRLGMALGGKPETFAGLAGMGDLVLTCTGALSRNRSVGVALGRGQKLQAILSETRTVAEGVKTSRAATELAQRHGVDLPISAEVYQVLYNDESPRTAIQRLMTRSLKPEAIH